MRRFQGKVFQLGDEDEARLATVALALGIDVTAEGQRSPGLRAVLSAAAEHVATLAGAKSKRSKGGA
jgi:hypothetical protein